MGEEVANTGRSITITPQNGATPGTPSYVQEEAPKLKAGGSAVLLNEISWTMAGCLKGTYNLIAGSGKMSATTTKVLSSSKKPMRKTDSGMCSGQLLNTVVPPGDTITCSCEFEITDAGQTKVKAT